MYLSAGHRGFRGANIPHQCPYKGRRRRGRKQQPISKRFQRLALAFGRRDRPTYVGGGGGGDTAWNGKITWTTTACTNNSTGMYVTRPKKHTSISANVAIETKGNVQQ